MVSASFIYLDGQEVRLGDKVCVDGNQIAYVDLILTPGTKIGDAYGCHDSPGFALKYEDGNYVVWNTTDFDLVLLNRKKDEGDDK
jgi:hypothetical protein